METATKPELLRGGCVMRHGGNRLNDQVPRGELSFTRVDLPFPPSPC